MIKQKFKNEKELPPLFLIDTGRYMQVTMLEGDVKTALRNGASVWKCAAWSAVTELDDKEARQC